jgi:hypothetical protein
MGKSHPTIQHHIPEDVNLHVKGDLFAFIHYITGDRLKPVD